jgi:hypothetical protein
MGCASSNQAANATTKTKTKKSGEDNNNNPSLHVQSVESDMSVESTVLKFDDSDWKAVHSAARWNKIDDLKQYLQDPRAADCIDTKNGNTPSHIAAQNGHLDGLQLLLTYKANVNAQNKKGNTPLHMALSYDYYDCVKLLLANGAKEDIMNVAGFPANRGLDGDKCIALVAFASTEKSKDKTQVLAALELCASSVSSLTKVGFAGVGLKVKKALGEQWTDDVQEKFKAIVDQLE